MKPERIPQIHRHFIASFVVLTGFGVSLAVTGCKNPGRWPEGFPSPDPSLSSTKPSPLPSGSGAVCDPLGGGAGYIDAQHGLIANLAYLKNTNDPSYSSVFNFEKQATPVSNLVYLSQLDVPTEYFEQGFAPANGTALTTASGEKLVQYFSLHIQSVVQLGPNDPDGDYQFAIASDDGAVVSVNTGNGMQVLINDDGDHPTQLGCAQSTLHLDHTMQLPITVDYYQGPPYNIALILLWRKVDPSAKWCSQNDFGLDIPQELNDPYCGQNGNNLFFNWSEQPDSVSTPNQNWENLLARGWSVVPAQDYYLPGSAGPNPCNNTGNQCYTDTFTQPGQTATSSADLLFVTDTSSNQYDRGNVAGALGEFAEQLPQGSNFQVATMLGSGDDSTWNGRLWHAPGVSPVLSSQSLSTSDMESLFGQDLQQLPSDHDSDDGELGLSSLSNSTQGADLTENQNEGFYRSSAALGIVFLADGPDDCSINPGAHPECSGVTPTAVLTELKALKANQPLSVNAIVPDTHCGLGGILDFDSNNGGDRYGSGYLDLVNLAGGMIFNLDLHPCDNRDSAYAQAMEKIGQAMAKQMQASGAGQLSDVFTLSHPDVNASTISVTVNGSQSQYRFNNSSNQVDLQDPGSYGSVVQVNYCVGPAPTPSPSPSPSATPSPSPSASATPSPSPSASATPSPSPSPSATPSPSPSPSCTGPFCGGGVLGQ